MDRSFEYKIQLSVGANDFSPDIEKILKNAQIKADKNAIRVTITGNQEDFIKQLLDLKKQMPNLDLTDGIEIHLADELLEQTDAGKKALSDLATVLANSLQEMSADIKNVDEMIGNVQKKISDLEKRKLQLFNNKDIKDASSAFDAAEKRFQEASTKFNNTTGKVQQRNLDNMRNAYQDMVNFEKEAGKSASAVLNRTQQNMGKNVEKEIFQGYQSLNDIKPTGTYAEAVKTINEQLLEQQSILQSLNAQRDELLNPTVAVKGKLVDTFKQDIQSQIDELGTIEVKVKPKVDGETKVEVGTAVDEEPTKILKQDTDEIVSDTETAVKNFERLSDRVKKYQEAKADKRLANPSIVDRRKGRGFENISELVPAYPEDVRNNSTTKTGIKRKLDEYLKQKKELETGVTEYGSKALATEKTLSRALDELAAYTYSFRDAEEAAEIFGEKNKDVFDLVQERIELAKKASKANTEAGWYKDFIIHDSLRGDYGVGKITIGEADQLMNAIESNGLEGFAAKVEELFGVKIPTSIEQAKASIQSANKVISTPPNTSAMDTVEEELHEETTAANETAEAERNVGKAREEANKTVYRAYNRTAGIMGEEGMGWFSDDPETMKTYVAQNPDRNVVKGQIDTSKFFKLDAQGAKAAAITYLGDQSDEASKKITEVYNKIQAIKKELAEKPSDALSEELKNLELEYDALSEDKSNMYGTHSSTQFAIRAKEAGYKGIEINNVVDDYNMKSGKTSTTIALFDNEALRETEDITSQIKGNIETTQQAFDRQSAINSHADFLLSREDIDETETDIDILTNKLEELNEENRLVSESAETLGEKLREITTATSEGNADIQNIKDYYSPEIGDVFDKETDIGKYYNYLVQNTDFGTTEEEVSAAYEQIAQKIIDFQKEVTNIVRSKIETIIGGSNQEELQETAEKAEEAEAQRELTEARREAAKSSPTQQFDNTVQKDLVYLENYKNTIEEINKLKLEPETDETKRKIEELQKLADYFFGSISVVQSEWGNDGGNFVNDPYGTYKNTLRSRGYGDSADEIFRIGREKQKLNVHQLPSEFSGIDEEMSRIETKSEGLRQSLEKDLSDSRKYVEDLTQTFKDFYQWTNDVKTEKSPSMIKAYNADIDDMLQKFPMLEQFRDKFSSMQEAKAFVNSNEWNDFLATLPEAHTYLESIGYDFERLNQESDQLPTKPITEEVTTTTSQLEKETEVKRDNTAATNELIEAEKKLREEASKPIPNIIDAEFREIPPTTPPSNFESAINKYIDDLIDVESQADKTSQAIDNLWNSDSDNSVDFLAKELHEVEVEANPILDLIKSDAGEADDAVEELSRDIDNLGNTPNPTDNAFENTIISYKKALDKLSDTLPSDYSGEVRDQLNSLYDELNVMTEDDDLTEWGTKFRVVADNVKIVNDEVKNLGKNLTMSKADYSLSLDKSLKINELNKYRDELRELGLESDDVKSRITELYNRLGSAQDKSDLGIFSKEFKLLQQEMSDAVRGKKKDNQDATNDNIKSKTKLINDYVSKLKEQAKYEEQIKALQSKGIGDSDERITSRTKAINEIQTEIALMGELNLTEEENLNIQNKVTQARRQYAVNLQRDDSESNKQKEINEDKHRYIELLKEENDLLIKNYQLEKAGKADSVEYVDNEKDIERIQREREEIQETLKTEQQAEFVKEEMSKANRSRKEAEAAYDKKLITEEENLQKRRLNLLQQITQWLNANPIADKKYGSLLADGIKTLNSSAEVTPEILKQIETEFKNVKLEATKAGDTGAGFFQILKKRWQSLGAYLGSFVSFYRVIAGVRQAFSTITELDTQLVDLRKTTKMNTDELNEFYFSANQVAKQMGVTTSEIISQAAAWSRLNKIGHLCGNI